MAVANQKKCNEVASPFVKGCRLYALLLCTLMSVLAACSSGPSIVSQTPTSTRPTPKPTGAPPGTILFQSDWSHGLNGWQATPGWTVVGDYLQSDLADDRSLTLPYRLAMSDYAVEFRLQVVNVPKDGGFFMLNADSSKVKDGYQAHILNLLTANKHIFAIHPLSEVLIEPLNDQMADDASQVFDFEPGPDWRTYRVEVQGSLVQFLVDGHRVSRARSAKTATLSNGPIHFQSGNAALRVTDFKVMTV